MLTNNSTKERNAKHINTTVKTCKLHANLSIKQKKCELDKIHEILQTFTNPMK